MTEYMGLINENAGVVALIAVIVSIIGITVSIIISCFLRWQGYEQGRDLREFLYAQAIERRGYGSHIEEEALEGSKHKRIKEIIKRIFG